MKKLLFTFIALLGLSSIIYTQSILKEYESNNIAAIFISNVNGSININSSDNNIIQVKSSDVKDIDATKLHQFMYADTLVIVMEDKNFSAEDCDSDYSFPGSIRRRNCNWSQESAHVNIDIFVPINMDVKASTINDGDISIKDIKGQITARNINGSISISKAQNIVEAHTINGDLNLSLNTQPQFNSKLYTLNGDINLSVPKKVNAQFTFKSFNGDFYTNIDNIIVEDSKIEKIKSRRKFHIKADTKTYMKVGEGGVILDLETFNGNVNLKTLDN